MSILVNKDIPMDIPVTQLPPGDPRLVEAIVGQLKSKGIFDQFRKECLADVDTKPAFQNLRQRVEGHVNKFLEKKNWKNDMNKNQLRDGVRKHVNNLGILDSGIDAIISQVVNPKIKSLILPYVEDTVYAFLQIDKPKRERKLSDPIVSSPILKEEVKKEEEVKEEEEEEEEREEVEEKPEIKPLPLKYEEPPPEEKKPDLLPMETDVISSEEDDILARESPTGGSKSASSHSEEEQEPPTEVEKPAEDGDENAQDGFESCPPQTLDSPDAIAANVERLQLSEDDSKSMQASMQASKQPLPLFDDQSLDSISSNSSGLTFSPLTAKGSPEDKKSGDEGAKSDTSPRAEMRSATSTPLVDEKPVDESSQSSVGSDHSKEFSMSEKMRPGDSQAPQETSSPYISSLQSNVKATKDGTSMMSCDEDSRESKGSSKASMVSGKLEICDKSKSDKSEGEISSSSSDLSDGDMRGKQDHASGEGRHSADYDSSHKSSRSKGDYKKRRDSHSRDRDREREREKDSRHHRDKERKHSKSRDDHHSHRDKDRKHHRRDKDHDGDKERSRSHHHQSSSSSYKESSGSKDKERSSHHSSGKSSEGKSRSSHASEKSDKKTKPDEKSEGKSHRREDKHSQNSEKKSDVKQEKRSVEKGDRKAEKPDRKSEKRERSDEKQRRKSESKADTENEKGTEKLEKKKDTKEERDSKSDNPDFSSGKASLQLKLDSEEPGKQKKSKKDKEEEDEHFEEDDKKMDEQISKNNNAKNGVCESLQDICEIDPQVFDLNGEKIMMTVNEGNFLLLTYDTDEDSVGLENPLEEKIIDTPPPETPPEPMVEESSNDFEGFESVKANTKLIDYLNNVVKVPDEMDKEYSQCFDDSDLHMTVNEDDWNAKVPLEDFLACMHRIGAVIKNEKGEVEVHEAKGMSDVPAVDIKEKTNLRRTGRKRKFSNSSSVSSSGSSTGSPKHKRYRRESSATSDISQTSEQDSVIVSGYALLTPEDDGNRSMSREYDIDYSQKMPNYSPLSPASDSSADESKMKTRGAVVTSSNTVIKSSTELNNRKTNSWPSKEAKFSV